MRVQLLKAKTFSGRTYSHEIMEQIVKAIEAQPFVTFGDTGLTLELERVAAQMSNPEIDAEGIWVTLTPVVSPMGVVLEEILHQFGGWDGAPLDISIAGAGTVVEGVVQDDFKYATAYIYNVPAEPVEPQVITEAAVIEAIERLTED
jgi:hypothetical protein